MPPPEISSSEKKVTERNLGQLVSFVESMRCVTVVFSKTSAFVVKQLIALNWITIVFIFDVTVSNLNQKYLCYWLFRDTFPISHPEKLRQSSLGILEERRRIRKKA